MKLTRWMFKYPTISSLVEVRSGDVERVLLESMRRVVYRAGDYVVMHRGELSPSPSLLSSFTFCPSKAWFEYNYGLTASKVEWLRRAAFGVVAHSRYESMIKHLVRGTVITEPVFTDGEVVGVPDVVIYNSDGTVDILELKTGRESPTHVQQLAAYTALIGEDVNRAVLVYMNESYTVNVNPRDGEKAIQAIKAVSRALRTEKPPKPTTPTCRKLTSILTRVTREA